MFKEQIKFYINQLKIVKMKRKLSGKTYVRPEMEFIKVAGDALLQVVSGNAGTIGGGGSFGDAKKNFFDGEEEEKAVKPFPATKSIWGD